MSSLRASSLYNVDGLVALITGGGTGIGIMMAKALVENGAVKVYIAARRLEPLQAAAKEMGPQVVPIRCDVTDKDDLMQAVQTVKSQVGYLNLLICNSGTTGVGDSLLQRGKPPSPEEFFAKHWAFDVQDYLHPFGVNVAGVWYTSVAFLPLLDAGNKKGNVSQSSQIIVISSTAGLSKRGEAGFAYGQSKAASIHLAKQLSTLLPQWGMRANCITPGFFPSDLVEPSLKQLKNADGTLGKLGRAFPLRRLGNEEDMGGTILYLASKAGAYTNGTIMLVDGAVMHSMPSVL
ncbi:hypothetical protein TCE0_041f14115 [Talaromyces pinophilus]|uniref:Uncharacterized protein n=1 Tax=Talaromyces pinophilus TaxID=128442 RepID=A0A6V8HH39_TALPI|nr:Rhamnolipids biosynthesis 3-oxoacyl-[acyl-carrier-protein] reductase [Talaromyces pinophilus]GAM41181.1 hypothetical protein TCE0_041f14115 [Talaromyces pinophilus]